MREPREANIEGKMRWENRGKSCLFAATAAAAVLCYLQPALDLAKQKYINLHSTCQYQLEGRTLVWDFSQLFQGHPTGKY